MRRWRTNPFTATDFDMRVVLRNGVHVSIWRFPENISSMPRYTANIAYKSKRRDHINGKTRRELFQKIRLEMNLMINPEFAKTHARLNPQTNSFQSMLNEIYDPAMLNEIYDPAMFRDALRKRNTLFDKVKPGAWESSPIEIPFEVENDKTDEG